MVVGHHPFCFDPRLSAERSRYMPLQTIVEPIRLEPGELKIRCDPDILLGVLERYRALLPWWVKEHWDPDTWRQLNRWKRLDDLGHWKLLTRKSEGQVKGIQAGEQVTVRAPQVGSLAWEGHKQLLADSLFEVFVTALRDSNY